MFEKHKSNIMDLVQTRKTLWEQVYTLDTMDMLRDTLAVEFGVYVTINFQQMTFMFDVDMMSIVSETNYSTTFMDAVTQKVTKGYVSWLNMLHNGNLMSDQLFDSCMVNPPMLFICTMIPSLETATHHRISVKL